MMITPLILSAFVTDMQSQIASINKSEVIIDDASLVNHLEELKEKENFILVAIFPEYTFGGKQDELKYKNQLMFMILKKSNYKNLKHSEFLTIMNETLLAANEFINILLSEYSGDNGDFCGLANDIIESSVKIYPIWNKSDCNGYAIDVDLKTNVE